MSNYTKLKHRDEFRVPINIRGFNLLRGPPSPNLVPPPKGEREEHYHLLESALDKQIFTYHEEGSERQRTR